MGKKKTLSNIIFILCIVLLVALIVAAVVVFYIVNKDKNKPEVAKAVNSITFDMDENLSCDIEAISGVGKNANINFDSVHTNAKRIKLSTIENETNFEKLSGDTSLYANTWSPWNEKNNVEVGDDNDTIYWIFKITNTSSEAIHVRLTDTKDRPLLTTFDNSVKLYKYHGLKQDETPTETSSGDILGGETTYLLVALENKGEASKILSDWKFKIHIEKALASYLKKDWYHSLSEGITEIEFLGGDKKEYAGEGVLTYKFGATDKTGQVALSEETDTVKQINGYVDGSKLIIHSPAIIYTPEDATLLFAGLSGQTTTTVLHTVTKMNLKNIDTINTKIMARMFQGSNVENIDLKAFDTINVTSMKAMFQMAQMAKRINVSSFDTSNVNDMINMFYYCAELLELDLSNFNTSNVTIFQSFVNSCISLTNLNLSSFDTSKAESLSSMFYACISLEKIDVSHFNTSNVKTFKQMFRNCRIVKSLDLSQWDTSNVTDMSGMFYNCNLLEEVKIENWDTSNVIDMTTMFYCASSIKTLDLNKWNVGNVASFGWMFSGSSEFSMTINNIEFENWDTKSCTDMSYMFQDCKYLDNLKLSNWNTSNVKDMSYMFYGVADENLDVSNWDVSKVTSMNHMFIASKVKRLDLSKWNTISCTDMSCMFNNCENLEWIDVSGFDTSNVISMTEMFDGCISLLELDLNNFNTSKVQSMQGMFGIESGKYMRLQKLNVSSFDTSNVTDMALMFAGCINLTELDLSSFYIREDCNLDQYDESGVQKQIGMLQIGDEDNPSKLTKLITPKYVGKAIDISILGFNINTIEVNTSGNASEILTKAVD